MTQAMTQQIFNEFPAVEIQFRQVLQTVKELFLYIKY